MSRNTILMIMTAAALLSGCTWSRPAVSGTSASVSLPESSASQSIQPRENASASPEQQTDPAAADTEDLVEYNGIYKKRSEVSEDTIRWLEWYHTLPKEQQLALNFVPTEFYEDLYSESPAVMETDAEAPSYLAALSSDELTETAELARYYFTELNPVFGGVEQIQPADDSYALYHNVGIENEYIPGNIIIYLVQTAQDKKEGNPMRSISIARRSKADEWKVINSGF